MSRSSLKDRHGKEIRPGDEVVCTIFSDENIVEGVVDWVAPVWDLAFIKCGGDHSYEVRARYIAKK